MPDVCNDKELLLQTYTTTTEMYAYAVAQLREAADGEHADLKRLVKDAREQCAARKARARTA